MSIDDLLGQVADGLENKQKTNEEKEKAKADLFHLGHNVLGYNDEEQPVAGLDVCHQELCDWIDGVWIDERTERLFLLILMPRGHLKSSVVTIGKSIQEILKKPDIRILITNAFWDKSREFLGSISGQLKKPYFKDKFGITLPYDTKDKLTVSTRRRKELTEPTIDTGGVEKGKTGSHYDMIIWDDLVCRENIGTPEQLMKPVTYYKDCLDLLEPNGVGIMIGTRWDDNDIYGQIDDKKNSFGNKFKVYKTKALVPGKVRVKEKDGVITPYVTPDSKFIFPKKFNEEQLCQLYEDKGQYAFYAQYFNETVDDEHATFKKSWLETRWKDNDIAGQPIDHYLVVDPAISEEKHSDFTGFSLNKVAPDGKWRIKTKRLKTNNPDKIIDTIFWYLNTYPILKLGIEVVAYQKALAHYINKRMMETNKYVTIVELKPDTQVSKEMRIKALQPYVEFGHLLTHEEDDELREEFRRFPRAKHDDLIDPTAYMVHMDIYPPNEQRKINHNPNSMKAIHDWAVGQQVDDDVIGNTHASSAPYNPYHN